MGDCTMFSAACVGRGAVGFLALARNLLQLWASFFPPWRDAEIRDSCRAGSSVNMVFLTLSHSGNKPFHRSKEGSVLPSFNLEGNGGCGYWSTGNLG